jgi:NTP pyrophosphatase (non-canonical NTP hydrolase)
MSFRSISGDSVAGPMVATILVRRRGSCRTMDPNSKAGNYHPALPGCPLPMDLQTYQLRSRETARYPDVGANPIYPTLGLCGEAGEVADKVKKVLRDQGGVFDERIREDLRLELGDVLWYVAQIATELDLRLEDIAAANLAKLSSRAARNVIGGSGDRR